MSRITLLYFCWTFCLPPVIIAQEDVSDQNKPLQALLDSSDYYALKDPAHALELATQILTQYPRKGNETYHIEAMLNAANSEKMRSGKQEALAYARQAISLSQQIQDQELLMRSYFMKASIFGQDDDKDSSLVAYQQVIDLYKYGMDNYFISSAYTNIGLVYSSIGNYPKAEEYLLKGYQSTTGDEYAKIFALASVISYYVSRDNPRYLPYLDTMAMSDFYKKASAASFMAHFDSFLLLDEATDVEKVKTLREVYTHSKSNSSLVNQVGFGMKLYAQLDQMHLYQDAYRLLLELLQKAKESQNGVHLAGVTRALYENSKSRGDLNGALEYLERHSEIRDSLLSDENTNRISELNIRFETVQKDHEIGQQKIKLEQERRDRNFFILLALMLFTMAIIVFIYFRNRARSSQRIAEQQKVIHRQETEQMQKEKEVAELTATLESQEKERNRIARDLHDGLGSMMSGISSQIEYLRAQPAVEQVSQPYLAQLKDMVKDATSELRRTSYELMPAKLLRQGLEPAIRDLCLNLLVKNGIEPSLEISADLVSLHPEEQLTLYRIIQELLNNIVRHAEARHVLIQFTRFDDELSLVVEDDGKGFDVTTKKLDGGLGLGSLGSRVNLLKGFLDIASTPGEGTTVTVNFSVRQ